MQQHTDPTWPDDPIERLEAKIDACRDEVRTGIYGGPGGPGIEPRLKAVEADLGTLKRAGGLVAAGGVAVVWDYIKRKFSL